ncbi:hypothetical protein CYMTET_33896, partial [Cymbomonas tetramitiformis]
MQVRDVQSLDEQIRLRKRLTEQVAALRIGAEKILQITAASSTSSGTSSDEVAEQLKRVLAENEQCLQDLQSANAQVRAAGLFTERYDTGDHDKEREKRRNSLASAALSSALQLRAQYFPLRASTSGSVTIAGDAKRQRISSEDTPSGSGANPHVTKPFHE